MGCIRGLIVLWVASCCLAGCGGDSGSGRRDAGPDSAVADSSVLDTGVGIDGALPADGAAPDAPVADGTMPTDGALPMDAPTGDGGIMLACSVDELAPIISCAADACVMLPEAGVDIEAGIPDASLPDPGELATCILSSCGTLLLGVSPMCRDCLIAGVGMDLTEISMRCAGGVPTP